MEKNILERVGARVGRSVVGGVCQKIEKTVQEGARASGEKNDLERMSPNIEENIPEKVC